MSITIQQGLRPLFLICFIMGLGVYPIKQSKLRLQWIAYLSILYFVTIWFVYVYLLFYTFSIFLPKNLLLTINARTILVINNFTAIMSAILIFYYHKKFQIYMKKLTAVDDTLEKLGTPKTYRKLHMLSKKVIIGWIVHALIINIYNIIWSFDLVKQVSWGFLLINIINHASHINEFTDLIFMFLLWYIGTKFEKLNHNIQCLLKEEHGLKYIWKKPVIPGYFLYRHNYKWISWTLMLLHLELRRIARELNAIFGVQITLGMMSYFGTLTSICYYFCCIFKKKHQDKELLRNFVGLSYWFLTCFIRLYAINHICESVKIKANNIYKITLELTNSLRYTDIWNEIYFFVLQVMQYPLKFTGLRLFYLGHKFLLKFVGTVVTFVIIMVQLNILAPFS